MGNLPILLGLISGSARHHFDIWSSCIMIGGWTFILAFNWLLHLRKRTDDMPRLLVTSAIGGLIVILEVFKLLYE